MNKFKLAGLGIAFVLLIIAIAAMQFGGNQTVSFILPVLSIGLWALTAVDIISYKKYVSSSKAIRAAELMRVVSLGVVSCLMTFAAIVGLVV
ncbi:MAG: hypothetical protein E7632_09075 [Ruminococcaceae bacterium]|nr:hypothetical protein [Oscillospiraceae bacterium]